MSASPDNGMGSLYYRSGAQRRASTTTVMLKGVSIDVEYLIEGEFLPATDIDDYCAPTARVVSASIGGVDCLVLLDVSELETLVERGWE